MSLINDITAAVGTRSAVGANGQQSTLGTGQQPGGPNAAQQIQGRFGGVFQTTFTGTMATVYERGASGEFDDQTLALAEQAAMHRLRAAQQQAANVQPVAAGSVPAGPEGGIGGDAPVGDAAPGSVMGGGGTAPVGANAAPDAVSVGVSEQRELHAVRVRQSEARLANISQTLARDLPLAAGLVSASSGTWDPATFVPQTKHQAEALAHRLVVDGMEAAARLEIVKTQLDGAVFEVSQGGGAGAQQLAA